MKYAVCKEWYEWAHSIGGQVVIGLEAGLGVSQYADAKYDWEQMEEIREGLEAGVDVSVYADAKYDWEQMDQIRLGLESGVDVSQYADEKYHWLQMQEIRRRLKKEKSNEVCSLEGVV